MLDRYSAECDCDNFGLVDWNATVSPYVSNDGIADTPQWSEPDDMGRGRGLVADWEMTVGPASDCSCKIDLYGYRAYY